MAKGLQGLDGMGCRSYLHGVFLEYGHGKRPGALETSSVRSIIQSKTHLSGHDDYNCSESDWALVRDRLLHHLKAIMNRGAYSRRYTKQNTCRRCLGLQTEAVTKSVRYASTTCTF